jgi:hypothetical protein
LQSAFGAFLCPPDCCCLPLARSAPPQVSIGIEPREIFKGADWALMVGAQPRGPGMERADLLDLNGRIFKEQGEALNEVASPDVKVMVVGNPCNTNALIAMENAPRIPRKNFHALTRLDENRCGSAGEAGLDRRGALYWGGLHRANPAGGQVQQGGPGNQGNTAALHPWTSTQDSFSLNFPPPLQQGQVPAGAQERQVLHQYQPRRDLGQSQHNAGARLCQRSHRRPPSY